MRILLISHYFWPESFRINQVVTDLIAAGADVTVLAGHPSYPEGKTYPGYAAARVMRERHPGGYDIIRVPVVPRGKGNAIALVLNYLSFMVTGILLGPWLLRGRKFDIIFNYCTTPAIQGFVGVWIKWLKGGRLVLWVQDLWPDVLSATGFVKSRFVLRLAGAVVALLYRLSDLVLGQSHAFVRAIRPVAGRTPVAYYPNPGEHPGAGAVAGPSLGAGFNVVFGGNLGTFQAVGTIVEAAALLKGRAEDICITLFGSGSMYAWIEGQIAERGLDNLVLGGRMPAEAMPGIYAQADALLLTLIDDPQIAQTVPSKFQSYLATGVPVIAAVNGEAAEIAVESGGGIACAAEDPAALADAIQTLKAMPVAARRAMGEAGCRFFAAHYEPTALARQLLDIFEDLRPKGRRT